MKKLFCVFLIVLTLCSLAACGKQNNRDAAVSNSTDDPTPTPSASQVQPTEEESQKATSDPVQSTDGIDVDLTKLSSTMVYSEVYNMMYSPDDYIGKTIKMEGQFAIYQATDETGALIPDQIYFACVIADATACCSQGLEFILAGEHTYPDDYPELGNEITVTGTFELYEEGGFQYCRLADAEMVE